MHPRLRAARVLFVASEAYPLAKTGGLADVSGALPAMLARLGIDVRVMLPGYPQALDLALDKHIVAFDLPEGRLIAASMPGTGIPVLLYDCPALFARGGGLYQDADGRDWPDNDRRFGMFCRAAVAVALGRTTLGWRPHLVHANDWHTGLVPALLSYSGEAAPKTVFTIHNLAFQGNFSLAAFTGLGLPPEALSAEGIEFYDRVSFMKAGLRYGDRLTTVSPTYAREILTVEHGCGFEGLLRTRARDLVGILNGIDESLWDLACLVKERPQDITESQAALLAASLIPWHHATALPVTEVGGDFPEEERPELRVRIANLAGALAIWYAKSAPNTPEPPAITEWRNLCEADPLPEIRRAFNIWSGFES